MTSKDPIEIGMRPCHPGEFIREEVLEPLNLSITKAAGILGVRRATVSDPINGKAGLSSEMALRVEKTFALDMNMMLRMRVWHDATVMRKRTGEIDVQRYEPA